jgi:hypothetical protein
MVALAAAAAVATVTSLLIFTVAAGVAAVIAAAVAARALTMAKTRIYLAAGGGGGGSFDGGTNPFFHGNINGGNGQVVILDIDGAGAPPVPEPSTWAMMAAGFAALGLAGLRRRRKA